MFLLALSGCLKTEECGFEGEWQAEWTMKPSDLTTDLAQENLKMSGIFKFLKDNTAIVTAYGYPGCLFCSDTLTNKLSWQHKGENLIMKNMDYDFTLEYIIEDMNGKSARLLLMDDIMIQLTKK